MNIFTVQTRFTDYFPDFNTFKTKVLDIISPNWGDKFDIFNEAKYLQTWEAVYNYLTYFYVSRFVRYTEPQFTHLFITRWLENLPTLYFQQIAYLNNQLTELGNIDYRGNRTDEDTTYDNLMDTKNTKSVQGDTNTGANPQTWDVIPTNNDGIYQKVFDEMLDTNVRSGAVNRTREVYNIEEDLKRLFEINFKLGLQDFAIKFDDLFVRFMAF